MKTWEYLILDSKDVRRAGVFKGRDRKEINDYLNTLGAEGWEIVNLDFRELDGRFEFSGVAKREKGG